MLHIHVLESLSKSPSRGLLALLQDCRGYSSRSTSDSETADLDAAREWFRGFNKSTIPEKIGKTQFSRSSGAGGQKVNKYVEQYYTIIIC
jgi:peptidyl-tRNA hydrolase ICT1